MATCHREFAKPWLYMLNKTHFLCCRMLNELQTEKMGASNGFQRKDNKENTSYDKMLESFCNEHQHECTIVSFEMQHLFSKYSTNTSVMNKNFMLHL
jgi:cupin superfamily acireductone dioxygenase involved in methionine salvage